MVELTENETELLNVLRLADAAIAELFVELGGKKACNWGRVNANLVDVGSVLRKYAETDNTDSGNNAGIDS